MEMAHLFLMNLKQAVSFLDSLDGPITTCHEWKIVFTIDLETFKRVAVLCQDLMLA